jgi:hypothetical protein
MKKFVMTAVVAFAALGMVNAADAFTYQGGILKAGQPWSQQTYDLQSCLVDLGVNVASNVDGWYGPITASAVRNFQLQHNASTGAGILVDGIIGPQTGPLYTAACNDADMDDDSSSDDDDQFETYSGEEGQLTSFELKAPEETEVDEGESDMGIFKLQFEADDSDQKISRVDVDFQAADTTESDKPWDYFTEVSLVFNGDVVETMDADSSRDWDKSDGVSPNGDIYSMRFSGLDLIVEEDEEADIEIFVSVRDNVDGSDEGQSWGAKIPASGIRAVSPNGLSETYASSAYEEDFTVAGSDTGTLEFAESSDNPDAMAISLDDAVDTNDVLLAVYNMEADNQDIFVEDLAIAVDITETGTATTMSQIVNTFYLVLDGETYAESASTSAMDADITFSNIDFTLDDGDDIDFEIYADFEPVDGTIVVAGDTIAIDIDASDSVAEQASGGNEGDSVTATGDIAGEDHAYFVDAPVITHVSSDITKTLACDGACASGEAERAEATITYTVKAVDADVYLPDELAEDADESDTTYGTGSTYFLDEHGGTEPTAVAVLTSSDAETDANGWVVRKGEEKTFKMNVTITAGADGYQSVGASSIEWALTSTAGGSATDYTYSLQPDWETDLIYLEYTA